VAYKKENVDKKAESGKYFEYRDSLDGLNKFEYVDDWGEKYVGLVSLSLNVLNTETGEVSTVEGIDDNIYTVGQPVFLPDYKGDPLPSDEDYDKTLYRLAYTAWKNGPKKLGMIYCYQRESSIFVVDLTKQLLGNNHNSVMSSSTPIVSSRSDAEVHVLVTKGVKLARSARFSPFGSRMVFLGSTEGFASHNGCSELLSIDVSDILKSLKTAQTRNIEVNGDAEKGEKRTGEVQEEERTKISTIVRIVPGSCLSESSKPDNTFPGIYADQLPRNCFLTPDCVIMSSPWGSVESTIIVELSTKQINKLKIPYKNIAPENEGKVSTFILDIQNSINNKILDEESFHDVLLSISTPSSSQVIGVLRVTLKYSRGNSSCVGIGISTSLRTPPENYKPNLMPITRKKNTKITNISPPLNAEKGELENNENENEIKNVAVKEVKKINTIDFNKMLSGASNFNHLLDWKTTRYHDDNGIPFESILISPKQGQNGVFNFETPGQNGGRKCPLIVVPHGGPHSCMTTSYVASYAFLALYLGAAVLHVNYRGSTGFGQDSIDYLLGSFVCFNVLLFIELVFCLICPYPSVILYLNKEV
jgi:Acylamino-acid-releasing enzyme, N-terminal domain